MLQPQRCRKISGILDRIVEKEGRLKKKDVREMSACPV